jgi:hypothetical protein
MWQFFLIWCMKRCPLFHLHSFCLVLPKLKKVHDKLKMRPQFYRLTYLDLSAFRPRGSLDRRVKCRCVPQPRWVGARWNTKGWNHGSCYPAPGGKALVVGFTSAREGERERDGASERARSSARRFSRATLSREGPGPSFYRCKERVQVYKWGVAMC